MSAWSELCSLYANTTKSSARSGFCAVELFQDNDHLSEKLSDKMPTTESGKPLRS